MRHKPHAACIVPERREERTTEGGLDAAGLHNQLAPIVSRLSDAGIRVSLFIEPDARQIDAAMQLKAPVVELHTGAFANAWLSPAADTELARLRAGCELAHRLGLVVNAGHGINYDNIRAILTLPHLHELNIGHSIISRAGFIGLNGTVGYGADTPFGGYKASGIGRELGPDALDAFTEVKNVFISTEG